MDSDNLYDIVKELKSIVAEFRRLLYGDPTLRLSGLIADLEQQRKRTDQLDLDVQLLKDRRPYPWLWIFGFLAFCAAVVLTIVAIYNTTTPHDLWSLPPAIAWLFAGGCALLSAALFVAGFGWWGMRW